MLLIIAVSWQPVPGSLHTGKQLPEHCYFHELHRGECDLKCQHPGLWTTGMDVLSVPKGFCVREQRVERAAGAFRQCSLNGIVYGTGSF